MTFRDETLDLELNRRELLQSGIAASLGFSAAGLCFPLNRILAEGGEDATFDPAGRLEETAFWLRDERNPVLPPRAKGTTDSRRCMNPWVMRIGDEYHLYYAGSDDGGTHRIHLAVANVNDVGTWDRRGPLFETGPEGSFDHRWCVLPHVVQFAPDRWHLYYTGNSGRGAGLSSFPAMGLAISSDGKAWKKYEGNPILERSGKEGDPDAIGMAGGSVIQARLPDGRTEWRFYYTGCPTLGKDLFLNQQKRVCLAISQDGVEWEKRGAVMVRDDERDYENVAAAGPVVHQNNDGTYRMWYSAIGSKWGYYSIGYAESDDGINWRRGPNYGDNLQLAPRDDGWEKQMVEYPSIIREGNHLRLFYCGNGYGSTGIGTATSAPLRAIRPDEASGSSAAVVVGPTPLAHTTQLYPVDENGAVVAEKQQFAQLLQNLDKELRSVGSGLGHVAKLNIFATSENVVTRMQAALAELFRSGAKPAVTYVVTELPMRNAVISLDAVAAVSTEIEYEDVHLEKSVAAGKQAGVAILPWRRVAYISGQAAPGELSEATRKTMEGLGETLKHLGLNWSHVVQVKSFMQPMSQASVATAAIERFFPEGLVPPLSFVQWQASSPIEIELIADDPYEQGEEERNESVNFITPPEMKSSPVFSRVAVIEGGKRVYVGGISAANSENAEEEVRDVFAQLKLLVEEAGSDMRHLAKGTYYVTEGETSSQFGKVRLDVYDPKRPPAASKATVSSVGEEKTTLLIDMIAATVE